MIKRVLKFLFILFLLTGLIFGIIIYYFKPNYQGNTGFNGLHSPVEVYYDTYGVPHIFADNEKDAMRVFGYIHAKERLWQMELLSRIPRGRLSEIFGEKLIKTDKFYLTLGIANATEKVIKTLDTTSRSYQLTKAYLQGVNNYVDNGKTPPEFYILGLDKRHYTIEDIYNIYGFMAYGFAMANQTDPLISALRNKLGDDYITQLELLPDKTKTLIHSYDSTYYTSSYTGLSNTWREIKQTLPAPVLIGSNSWVLAPSKTRNHHVIFENDPHIGFSQPAVWFEAHIITPETEVYGFHLALNPFPLLAHNHHQVYGLTMLENDDIDLYLEKTNKNQPGKYLLGDTYKDFVIRKETIPVKGREALEYTIRESIHGPVMNDVVPQIKTSSPVSMYWIFTQRPNRLNEALFRVSRAKNIEEFKKGVALIHAPGLNVMYGDDKGNTAWWAAAQLYERENQVSTKMLIDGSLPTNHSLKFLPFEDNPHAVNPPWDYVYSCNNQPDTLSGRNYVPGYFLPEDRAKRVVENVSKWKDATLEQSLALSTDDISSTAPTLLPDIIHNLKGGKWSAREKKALDILEKWDFSSSLDSRGATIYTVFIDEFEKEVFQDEMGEEIFNEYRHTYLAARMISQVLMEKFPIWIDDIRTADHKENLREIQIRAFNNTVRRLSRVLGENPDDWAWKRIHSLEHKHALGEVKLLRGFFNVGPYPIAGNKTVLNNQMFDRSKDFFHVTGGPSTRRIIDFSDIEHARGIIPTGQSGNPFSPHYRDQAELYNRGEFRILLLNKDEIKSVSTLLRFIPE